ncbi:hypothetical protein Q9233_003033 [Columba guinea]|nr:hypothetical protein Q9233_003033 [Columba guinea]
MKGVWVECGESGPCRDVPSSCASSAELRPRSQASLEISLTPHLLLTSGLALLVESQKDTAGQGDKGNPSKPGVGASSLGLWHLPKAKPLGTWPKVSVVSCPADPLSSPFLSLQVQHNELAS